ncbi:hypothetical protein PFAG_01859 [Plasmodium falciparum Santa Lucia]|uniref:Uncharacterized protein n=6 Tax=Plasmodium falciparum TaxID=5833 RepID=W4J478_PLAFP|nr:hypothetical protein PFFVO_01898 [Plasmodium falciparum Vietnam Oak-Knoll (FVO)]ETW37300.1 hypothetical protein PFTANZ_01991 [Plasmodium falciparum Tanzania (2000708)]ETW43662.1 hypothetical protein PFNF135_02024 [Plasmodium falciparum NF135/5.C10]ETW57030.1 hypothetical protein PFUGPA_01051 [Plasmodium falciparum Palo Alto/Uganda]EUR73583.1 hypothetical protein PFBG_01933 [Plasmodium falciparum 7G8]EUT87956.1 hypothetical protein PFAG_01859 [Plasmodium falciparum Santa Lucia]
MFNFILKVFYISWFFLKGDINLYKKYKKYGNKIFLDRVYNFVTYINVYIGLIKIYTSIFTIEI